VEDEGGHDAQRDAVDALGAEEHVVDDPRDRVAPVREDLQTRDVEEVGPHVAVDQDQHGDDRKRRADAAPRPFQDQQEREAPDEQLGEVGAAGPDADVVELEKDKDGDHAGHEREEDIEVGHVVLPVIGGAPVLHNDQQGPDPVEDEEGQDGREDPEQEDPPENEGGVQVLEPGAHVEVGGPEPHPPGDEPDHGGVNGEVHEDGQPLRKVVPLLEVQDEGEGDDGKGSRGAEGQRQDLPEYGRVEHGRHGGIENVVDEVLGPLEVDLLLHGVDEVDQGQHEGQVEGPMAPFLEHAEPCRVDVEDRQDDRHGEDQLRRDPDESAEPHLRVVLGDLFRVIPELGRGDDFFFLVFHVVLPGLVPFYARRTRESSSQANTRRTEMSRGPSPASAGRNTSSPAIARVPPYALLTWSWISGRTRLNPESRNPLSVRSKISPSETTAGSPVFSELNSV